MHPPKKKQNKKQTNKTHAQPLKGEGKISWRWNDNLRSNRANQEEFYSFSEFSTKVKRSRVMHCTDLSRERQISAGPVKVDRTCETSKSFARRYASWISRGMWLARLWITWLLVKKGGKPREVVRQPSNRRTGERSRGRHSWINFLWNVHWNCTICTMIFSLAGLIAISVDLKKKTVSLKEKFSFCGPRP